MQYIAHKDSDGTTQSVKEHLSGTADLAKSFAVNAFSNLAYNAGLLHDLGKYSSKFQRRINGEDIRVEHAISGAKEVELLYDKNKFFKQMLKSCIAGHHSGLPDGGSDVDLPEKATLSGRMKRKAEDFSAYKEEIQPKDLNTDEVMTYFNNCLKTRNLKEATELYAFMTKYLYSCLVDADFIDTEKFFEPNVQRGMKGDFKEALNLLNERLAKFSQDNEVRKGRSELQKQALENSYKSGDISILNMPTGSGKTLCSLKIALEQAIRENKKRIIYIIPYTSIIEQTAETFEGIFGKVLPVLQHHSNYSFEKEESENTGTAEKLKRTCENWDSKLIISTSVQFFQSIYHYRSSRLRKLHNLADSIIIFDEIHMIPIEHLQPCLRAI
ncbi:MAG: CRISPR-associated endonuclease Cas3'', partial [Clostridiales bacterium]|nr:CRISPR-associated endonuclease Cas3'' [Clostridiales bacterium]